MKDFRNIALFVLVVGAVPFFTQSGVVLNFVMTALYACLLSQAWNVLGGFGGQFSFGHALFFGTGAYVQAIAQMQWGLSPWVALPLAMATAAGVGAFVGAASFRYGLKGSYFALVTLAFAEVFRIVATSVPFTGAGVGLMLPLKESAANMQFANRSGFIWLMLGLVTLALCITAWLKRSRFGAYLQAVRDNEDAARAIGVGRVDGCRRCFLCASLSVHRPEHCFWIAHLSRGFGGRNCGGAGHPMGTLVGGHQFAYSGGFNTQFIRTIARHQHGDLRRCPDFYCDVFAQRHCRFGGDHTLASLAGSQLH
jgi:hypothetical protein